MPEPETITAEVEEVMGQALEVSAAPPPSNLFNTEDPGEVIRRATAVAETLKTVLVQQNLISRIKDREHVRVEGWTLLGTMLGVFPVCTWTRKTDDGWEARVEARTLAGAVVGAAEAECLRSESTWKSRDDYALRSMAQTRATSKALRQPLGFVVSLAGFDPTPAEEIGKEDERRVEGGNGQTPVPRSWAEIKKLVSAAGEEAWPIFEAYCRAYMIFQWDKSETSELTRTEKETYRQAAAGSAVWINDNDNTPIGGSWSVDHQRAGWKAVTGFDLEIPDYSPPENSGSVPVDDEAERLADEAFEAPA